MRPEDANRLIGGYATGNLTPEERRALFEAALNNQGLFDELAAEQPLRELLSDPAARAELLAAAGHPRRSWADRLAGFVWQPAVVAPALTILVIAGAIILSQMDQQLPEPILSAELRTPEPVRLPAPSPPQPRPPKRSPETPKAPPRLAARNQRSPELIPAPPPVATPPPATARGPAPPAPLAAAPVADTSAALQYRAATARAEAPVTREMVETGLVSRTGAAPQVLPVLRYKVLRQSGDTFVPVAPAETLHAGEALRVSIESSETGYLKVTQKEGLLFSGRVQANQPRVVPATGELRFAGPGRREVEAVFTRAVRNVAAYMPSAGVVPGRITLKITLDIR